MFYSTPVVSDGVVYAVNYFDQQLLALSAATGEEIWTIDYSSDDLRSSGTSSPVVIDDAIYFVGDQISKLSKTTGDEIWTHNARGNFSPAASNGMVYVPAITKSLDDTDSAHWMLALDSDTGKEIWSFESEYSLSSPAVSNGVIYFRSPNPSGESELWALDATTGYELWGCTNVRRCHR